MINLCVLTSGNYAGRIAVEGRSTLFTRIKEIPGALYSRLDQVWTVPRAYPQVLALGELSRATGEQLSPSKGLQEWLGQQKLMWTELGSRAQRVQVPDGQQPEDLFRHQVAAADWLSYAPGKLPGRLLLDEVGAGKTRSVYAGIEQLTALDKGPVLVICPNKVKGGWRSEAATYLGAGVRVEVVRGTAVQRRKSIAKVMPHAGTSGKLPSERDADVLVIGWESMRTHTRLKNYPSHKLRRCAKCGGPSLSEEGIVKPAQCQAHEKELNKVPWSVIVADEIHRCKSAKSLNAMALWGLSVARPVALRWGLSGTPSSKSPEDLWPLLHWIDPVAWPVKSAWVDYYCRKGYSFYGFFKVEGIKPEKTKEFHKTFDAVSRRVLKDQVLDLPEVLRGGSLVRSVDMGKEQAAPYAAMRDEMIAWVKEGKLTAANVMVKSGRLMFLAQAYCTPLEQTIKVNGEEKKRLTLLPQMPSCKVEALVDDIAAEDYDGHQVITFFESRKLLELAKEQIEKKMGADWNEIVCVVGGMDDYEVENSMELFQAGKKQHIFLTYGAAREGITLTAADIMLLPQRSWSQLAMTQALARFHRPGAEKHSSLTVIDYVTAGTIEQLQMERNITDQNMIQEIVQDAARMEAFLRGES